MGSDNLFHKNRERNVASFKSKKPKISQGLRVLIVCEDSKSSVFYFEEMVKDLGLTAVKVRGKECGSAPSSVLKYAQNQYEQSKKEGDTYDAVYCVFDRDQHPCFDATVAAINDLKTNKKPFFVITTTPCFEFWLLLHFAKYTSPYQVSGNKSSCDNANADLQTHWKKAFNVEYGKNKRDIYPNLKADKTVIAIQHAKKLVAENLKNGSINPQTNMQELVEYLQSLSKKRIIEKAK